MLPAPRRTISQPAPASWAGAEDEDDEEGWQDMPVVRSDETPFDMDDDDERRNPYRIPVKLDQEDPTPGPSNATGARLELESDTLLTDSWRQKAETLDESDYTRLRLDEDEESDELHMRTKYLFDEDKAMTPLKQMQATKELLTEGQRIAYVGLCYLVARRMVRDVGRGWEGHKVKFRDKVKGKGKGDIPVVESANLWILKIMARMFQHMELNRAEQHMIESLGEHGVDPSDLVPALMTTHTVKNPEYDPKAKEAADAEASSVEGKELEQPPPPYEASSSDRVVLPPTSSPIENTVIDDEIPVEPTDSSSSSPDTLPTRPPAVEMIESSSRTSLNNTAETSLTPRKPTNPFGDDSDDDDATTAPSSSSKPKVINAPSPPVRPSTLRLPSFHDEASDDEGDIGRSNSPIKSRSASPSRRSPSPSPVKSSNTSSMPNDVHVPLDPPTPTQDVKAEPSTPTQPDPPDTPTPKLPPDSTEEAAEPNAVSEQEAELDKETDPTDLTKPSGLPSLPGVSTSLTNADETVTLDIRWTILCDLFLVLIADSVYDARSRVFLEKVAEALGFEWLDVVRFENRVTDALEIQEGIEKAEQGEIIEDRRKGALKRRYAMMGAAALGGGLVIGLSAGLLAPVIGAGLGAAFATVGISGTTGFLAGAGGAAVITTGGVLTGANIATRGMARRTREVRTFELRPLHNNKRVSCYVTVGGFMSSKMDDVRLPFSVLDPVIGDVLSVFWEPEMMAEMGNALKILTSEILTQVGQQVLQATVMYGLMSALQWPIILTKLGYLIDNPWSNALDRAHAAGLILADTLIQRHAGVRPISLIGYSLGARVIFYALVELAKAKAFGLVQDVYIFGATVTANKQTWLDVRSIVAGRFVNGYAGNDWMLGYLFRATSGGLNTVAGLRPVEVTPGLENLDVTEIITGHMSYRSCMPQLLALVGFPVTAEFFDEPDDPDVDMTVQERTILNEAKIEAQKKKKILGIFPVRQSGSASGTATPTPDSARGSYDQPDTGKTKASGDSGDDDLPPREDDDDDLPPREDDDDLPPREEVDIGLSATEPDEKEQLVKQEAEAVRAIPKTAGFDFQAISKELGKDIDVDQLRMPSRNAEPPLPLHPPPRVPIDRAGSAPLPEVKIEPATDYRTSPTFATSDLARTNSYMDAFRAGEGMDGDITASLATVTNGLSLDDLPSWERPLPLAKGSESSMSVPSWDKPSPQALSPTSPLSATSLKSPQSFFNAWSSSSMASTGRTDPPPRPAPPARPHPPEYMVNPFANSEKAEMPPANLWKKRDEDVATGTQNPW